MCDKCYRDINRKLTQKELFDNYISINPVIINKIKNLLNVCNQAIGKNNKAKEVFHIFDLIYHNIYFTFITIKFTKTLIKKIIDFVTNEIEVLNTVVDEQIKSNETYIDILDFMININDYYKDINIDNLSDEQFLLEYNNFMKGLYNSICIKYNNIQSLNKKNNIQTEKQEIIKNQQNTKQEDYNICDNQIYNSLKEIQIDV